MRTLCRSLKRKQRLDCRIITEETVLKDADEGRVSSDLVADLGQRVANLRKRLRLSQRQLAERVGVSRERLGRWERGLNAPPLPELVGLARALDAGIDELLTGRPALGARLPGPKRKRLASLVKELNELLNE